MISPEKHFLCYFGFMWIDMSENRKRADKISLPQINYKMTLKHKFLPQSFYLKPKIDTKNEKKELLSWNPQLRN